MSVSRAENRNYSGAGGYIFSSEVLPLSRSRMSGLSTSATHSWNEGFYVDGPLTYREIVKFQVTEADVSVDEFGRKFPQRFSYADGLRQVSF